MRGFITALTFLTIFRIDLKEYDNKNAVFFFPLVGVLISIPAYFLLKSELPFKFIFTLLYLIVITGALHIDGLADTADAFFSHKDREKKLEIMKDSRIGTMGAVAVILILLFKYELLKVIEPFYIILSVSYSRLGALIIIYFLPYARQQGTGAFFSSITMKNIYSIFLIIPPIVSFIYMSYFYFFLFNISFILISLSFLYIYKKVIGGWTGDMVGAYIEISEVILLYLLTLAFSVNWQ